MIQIDPHAIWDNVLTIKRRSPLVHNITNYVVMEQSANSLLAIGASPVMAHAVEEVGEMVMMANSLVLNIGTLSASWVKAMMLALKAANLKGIPVLFDPVGVGSTAYRTGVAFSLLNHGAVSVIRGNTSEIVALNGNQSYIHGVESLLKTSDHIQKAKELALKRQCIVWMSGETDVITDGEFSALVHNGHHFMSCVTGMGCTSTAITAAFLAVNKNPFLGAVYAAIFMGVSGEVAAKHAQGPGSFKIAFNDVLYSIGEKEIGSMLRFEFV